ncbi:MAG: ImmA/IrrE family metallo-endopeptidase [bacterium]|nr:ImmA/IrrE family metallo-endopeptidase [bacterium]
MPFNGERLKTARIFRNMTVSELADKVGVTKQAISQYEKNQSSPKPDTLFQFVCTLGFPKDFFLEEDDYRLNVENTFFRALSTTKNLDLKTQEIKTEIISRIYNFLGNYLNFPALDIPELDIEKYGDIENLTSYLRSYWELGDIPIENMVGLLEKKGIVVSSLTIENRKIDAFTQIHEVGQSKQYCVVLGNDKQSMVRRNFDAAHELGHIILHNKLTKVEELSREEFKHIEDEANNFAAAFLLPRNSFFLDLKDANNLDAYLKLKKKWKVSIAAMVMRAKHLGRINNNQYQYLMKQISARKWRICEPFDDIWELQRPILFKKSIQVLKENNVLTGTQFLIELSKNKISLDGKMVETLLDLDEGTLVGNEDKAKPSLVLSIKR